MTIAKLAAILLSPAAALTGVPAPAPAVWQAPVSGLVVPALAQASVGRLETLEGSYRGEIVAGVFNPKTGAVEWKEGSYRGQVVTGAYNASSGRVEWFEGKYIGHVVAVVSTFPESATLQTSSYAAIVGEDSK